MRYNHLGQATLIFVIVSACSSSERLTGPCDPSTATRQFTAPWAELSDSQLRIEIERACGRVFVGFKEAQAARGVDAQGRSLTTQETVTRMKQYLIERGITVEWAADLPHVTGTMPPRLELVRELRDHPNVDYLEPVFPGSWN